jgi:phospholipid/cholesterol/gamma-HCH transport system ATP-binding protein
LIQIQGLHKWFGAQHVLQGVDLTIKEGETVVIIGRSGCGKSVLLKHIMAILEPDEGDIKIDGRSMFSMDQEEQDQCRLQLGMLSRGRRFLTP